MQSLTRKLALRASSEVAASALHASKALARTGQVARTTLELGDGDVFLDEALSSAADTSETVGDHEGELEGSRELTDDVVDVLPDMTEDAWEAEEVGQIAADGADWAAEFAAELEVELEAAKVELEQSLEEAHQALTEAGLARSEAAQAVADAQAAVTEAGTALTEAIAAAQAASDASVQAQLADGRLVLSDAVPVAADGQGKPVGALWMRKTAGAVTAMWEWTALGWVSRPLAEQIIPKILIGEGTYGDLDGVRLTAKTVGAEKLLVGDFQNYWNDPEFRNTAGYSPWDVVGRGLERNGTGTQSGGYFPHTEISVQPGERLKFTVSKSHVAGTTSSVSLYVQRRTADGASAGSNTAVLQLAGGDGEYTSEWVVPASVERLTFGFYTQAATTSSVRVRLSNVRVSKMTAGELIVDGTIRAQHLAALAVTAEKLAAEAVTAVKIAANAVTADKLVAGAVTTDKLYTLAVTAEKIAAGAIIADKIAAGAITTAKLAATAIDGMTITGATIRTAATGQRMEFNIHGLRAIAANGSVTATISSASGGVSISGPLISEGGGASAVLRPAHFQMSTEAGTSANTTTVLSPGSLGANADGGNRSASLSASGDAPQLTLKNLPNGASGLAFEITQRLDKSTKILSPGRIEVWADEVEGISFFAPATFYRDTAWANVFVAGATGTCQWRRSNGIIYLRFDLTLTSALAAGANRDPVVTLPAEAWPGTPTPINVGGGLNLPAAGRVWTNGNVSIRNNNSSSEALYRGFGQWPQ